MMMYKYNKASNDKIKEIIRELYSYSKEFYSVCPVVFEMLERLKKTYGFKRRGLY